MKVVIFIDWFTPAYKAGGPIQSILNLVNQKMEEVEYKIICSNKDLDGNSLSDVSFDRWVDFNASTQVWYNSDDKAVLRLLGELSKWKPDVFFINGIYSWYYNFLPIVFGKAGRKIISTRGMLHAGALSQKSLKKKIYLGIWKQLNIHKKHSFHATNLEEEKFVHTVFGNNAKVYVAQNLPRIMESVSICEKETNSLQLISIGLVSPMKNYLEVIKSLSYCTGKIDYAIYGPIKDATYWQDCMDELKTLPGNIKVQYQGDLPSSQVRAALSQAHVFILPSKSENFGHAIYEALTAGLPVITSHHTPWNNLKQANAGFNVSVDNHYELSESICFFAALDNKGLAQWSEGAKAYAERSIDIHQIRKQYQRMFSAVD